MTAGLLCPTKLFLTNRNKRKKHWLLKSQRKNVRFLVLFLMLFLFSITVPVHYKLQTCSKGRKSNAAKHERNARWSRERMHSCVPFARTIFFFFFHAGLRSAALIKQLLGDGCHSSFCSIKSLPQF